MPPRWLFLKVSTDEGISGWGEPIVEGHAETVRAAVREMSEYLIGKDRSGSRTTSRCSTAGVSTGEARS